MSIKYNFVIDVVICVQNNYIATLPSPKLQYYYTSICMDMNMHALYIGTIEHVYHHSIAF